MKTVLASIKSFMLDLLFPQSCLYCEKEEGYLCQDCLALIDILERQFCPHCGKIVTDGKTCKNCRRKTKLNGLYFAVSYQNKLVQKIITQFKYEPFLVKELAKPLASLILTHFYLLDKKPNFSDFIIIPIPLLKKRLKQRGFNQAEELAKELSKNLELPLINNILTKTKETLPQVELSKEKRRENIKGAFLAENKDIVKNQKILLVDDVYTTGSTMEECARVLKESGAKEVWGVVVTRG